MNDTLFGVIPTYFSVVYLAIRVSGHSTSKTAEVAVFLPTCRVAGSGRRALPPCEEWTCPSPGQRREGEFGLFLSRGELRCNGSVL